MTYTEIINTINALSKDDQSFVFKACIASAVMSEMDIGAYDDEGFEEVCSRFAHAVAKSSGGWPAFGEVAYRAQQLIDDGKYETPTLECFMEALADYNG